QTQGYVNTRAHNNATDQGGNRNGAVAQPMAVKCYNCQEEGYFARQCTKPKRPKNSTCFKEKMLMTEALESRAYLDPEQLAFLADNEDTVIPAQASQEIPSPAAFQTDDLDAFDSDCDDVPSAKAVLMANLSSYDSDVLSEVPFHDTNIENDMSYQKLSEHFVKHFVPKKQLSVEQAFWLPISQPVSKKQPIPSKPVLKKEIPRKLPPISLV
ncbi:retrovirus-related pol polyprotein from transposon TNT 1-94, partial [Tanacetum coccineum]